MRAARLGLAVDLLSVVFLLGLGRLLLPADPAPEGPFWARRWDLIIFGPDSGAWAANAWAVFDGRFADLDPHRMPTWPILIALTMRLVPDVALAGHLVNHLLQALLPVAIWGIARLRDGRATGLAAGVATVCIAPGVTAAQRFGVDTAVAALLPLALLAAVATGRAWGLGAIAGLLTVACAVSHLSTVAFPVPVLLALLACGPPGWRRWAALGLALLCGGLLLQWLLSWYPLLPKQFVANVYAEGIAPGHHGGADAVGAEKQAAALEIIRANAPRALDDALRFLMGQLRPSWLPWSLALALPWLGVVGPLDPRRPFGEGLLRGLALGVPLLLCLVPIVAFHAAKAPTRYSENLLPVATLLFVRGAMFLPSLLDRALGRLDPRLVGIASFALALPWMKERWDQPRIGFALPPPRVDELLPAAVGKALVAGFPTGVGAVSAWREALGYGGFLFCPSATCPFRESEVDFVSCVEIMRKECRGEGPIPYVVYPNPRSDLQWPARTSMDAWIKDRLPAVATIEAGGGSATLHALPRSGPIE